LANSLANSSPKPAEAPVISAQVIVWICTNADDLSIAIVSVCQFGTANFARTSSHE